MARRKIMPERDASASAALLAAIDSLKTKDIPIRLLQIGACDGVNFDPLHKAVDTYDQVYGIFFEPIAEYAVQLFENKRTLKGLSVINSAVSSFDGVAEMRYVDFDAIRQKQVPQWALGISTLEKGKNAIDGQQISPENHALIQAHTRVRTVPVISTSTMLKSDFCRSANVYLSDCEGHDATIFLDLDLKAFTPKLIFMESMLMSGDEKHAVHRKLAAHGYSTVDDGTDIFSTLDR